MKITKRLPLKNILNYHPEIKDRTEEVLERKSLVSTFTNLEEGEVIGVISTPSVDSDGDIIDPMGVKTDIYTGALIFNHCLDALPIGNVSEFTITPEGVKGKFTFSKTYDFSVDCYNLIKEGILRGISIGYIPLKALKKGTAEFAAYAKARGWDIEGCSRIITECLWIETSCVVVGANSDALILAAKNFKSELSFKSFNIDSKKCDEPIVEEKVNEPEISKETSEVNTNMPEVAIGEDITKMSKEAETTEIVTTEITSTEEIIPEVQTEDVSTEEEIPTEVVPKVEVPSETSPVEPKQAPDASEVVPPITDTIVEEVVPEVKKPIVIKCLRKGPIVRTEAIRTKALRFLSGKSI